MRKGIPWVLVALVAAVLLVPAGQGPLAEGLSPAELSDHEPPGTFEIVGHDPLGNRGMNAALAVHGDYAYVGSRTDGKVDNLNDAGIMVVDISEPADPTVVNQISTPYEGNQGESSREMRVWQAQDILVVLHTNCSNLIHYCAAASSSNSIRFYDIAGDNAADPELILEYDRNTHEYFLWQDPFDPDFALLVGGSAGGTMQVWDISPVPLGQEPIELMNGRHDYNGGLHSLSVSNDGRHAYFALLTGGFAVADVSDFTQRVPNPQLRHITPPDAQPTWDGPGAHSAVKLFGRDWVYVSDEVYGEAARALGPHGCPWGWARMIDISDPTAPTIQGEYRLPENDPGFCMTDVPRPSSSYSAHNPTQTANIVFSSWHSGGMQAIGVADPANPVQLAELRPEPLPYVVQEDPMLSAGLDKVVMWSYPVIQDGLIYVADLRNGLYVLRYTGPHQEEVDGISFLEGNSNQADALCFEPPVPARADLPDIPAFCR